MVSLMLAPDACAVSDTLFQPLEDKFGPLDYPTRASKTPVYLGGHVSLGTIPGAGVFVTQDLSDFEGQTPSEEGFRYELFMRSTRDRKTVQEILDFVARSQFRRPLSTRGETSIEELRIPDLPSDMVRFKKFSETRDGLALYQVSFARRG